MEELRTLVGSYGCLYHITLEERWSRIQEEGIDPTVAFALSGGMYSTTPFGGRGFNCFTIPSHLGRVVQMLDDGMGGIRNQVILQVPALAIAERSFDLDRTKQEIRFVVGDSSTPSTEMFRQVIETHGYLVCFDMIPTELIRLVCRAEEFKA